ncbi:MAG: hypothetical protein HY475_01370 [Candidatus Terrybacteria bacterium]|nr:hypothetical protein [Candidatus Terrybacteria bacterium]
MNDSSSPNPRTLEQEATRLLRSRGYTWSGRPRDQVDPDQAAFEQRAVRTPTGGLPGRRRKHRAA